MATGAYPPNPGTPVGLFRIQIGDDTATSITGTSPNQTAEYEFFSDDAIEAYLDSAATPAQAQANALRTMGRKLVLQAQDIQVDDIRIKTVERANIFMTHADALSASDAAADAATAFSIVPLRSTQGTTSGYYQIG